MNKILKPIYLIAFNMITYFIFEYIFISIFPVEYFYYLNLGILIGIIWYAISSSFCDYLKSR